MADWFRRQSKNINTNFKRDTLEGSWVKCPSCSIMLYKNVLVENFYVCNDCQYHFRIKSADYVNLLIDNSDYDEFNASLYSSDPLNFSIPKKYTEQIEAAKKKTNKNDAVITLQGKIFGESVILGVMDFSFIGGSMGSVVGQKISDAIVRADDSSLPLIIVAASGGARMQEGVISLMQLAKISTKLAKFSDKGGLYIVILTDPTTGGISASFGMQGDVILAEPNALIGFAGPRVIKQTIGENLPEGFQKSEFLMKKGFLDNIVHRKDLKATLKNLVKLFLKNRDKINE